MPASSPWMDTGEVAVLLRFVDRETGAPDRNRAWHYLEKRRVPYSKRGRTILVRREDVEKSLEHIKR